MKTFLIIKIRIRILPDPSKIRPVPSNAISINILQDPSNYRVPITPLAIFGHYRYLSNPFRNKKCMSNQSGDQVTSFFMVCFGYYKHRWRKRSKNGHFEPKNWSHIFLEADLAKILMDYVLLTLPASLANFFHGLIWKSLA